MVWAFFHASTRIGCSFIFPPWTEASVRVSTQTATNPNPGSATDPPVVELRDPRVAAVLAWLIPGAGHLYQGRTAKGILFMTCILGIYFFGMYLGEGHVVYASMRGEDRRLPYLCQIGVGLPALPALVQSQRMREPFPKAPLWNGWMAPPRLPGQIIPNDQWAAQHPTRRMVQTDQYVINEYDELSAWHERLHGYFELGTVYTMIAGLLNILAIYDAGCGPLLTGSQEEGEDQDASKKKS